MIPVLARRLASSIPVVLLASLLIFLLVQVIPGDQVEATFIDVTISAEAMDRIRESLGLNDPLHVRYLKWIWGAVQGDFGESYSANQSVSKLMATAIPATLQLTVFAAVFGIAVGIPAGILSAVKRNSWMDFLARWLTLSGVAIPNFFLGVLLILLFSYQLGWLPAIGYVSVFDDPVDGFKRTLMPAIALGSSFAAILFRQMRGALLEVLQEDYVRTARSKGLQERTVILRHAVRNAALPVLTILGMNTGRLIGGAVVTERVFAYPGVGRLALDSIRTEDMAVLQAVILLAVMSVILANAVTDILYTYLDPRIRA